MVVVGSPMGPGSWSPSNSHLSGLEHCLGGVNSPERPESLHIDPAEGVRGMWVPGVGPTVCPRCWSL